MRIRASIFFAILMSMLLLSGCVCKHEWKEATCDSPKICDLCGKTEGEAKEHNWKEATCNSPKTCDLCGKTEGTAKEHNWKTATCFEPEICTLCGERRGEKLSHELDYSGKCKNCSEQIGFRLNASNYKDYIAIYTDYSLKRETETSIPVIVWNISVEPIKNVEFSDVVLNYRILADDYSDERIYFPEGINDEKVITVSINEAGYASDEIFFKGSAGSRSKIDGYGKMVWEAPDIKSTCVFESVEGYIIE